MRLGKHWAVVIALCLGAQAYPTTTGRNSPPSPGTAPRHDLSASLIQRPVVFEPNVGQFEPGVRYRAAAPGISLSFNDSAAVLSLSTNPGSQRHVRITPVNASRRARPRALDRLAGVVNHFESAAPSRWHAGVPTYGRVRYPAVYPGIDLVYHGSPEQLEYDFVVARGADPSRIAVRFDGADRVELDPTGELLIHVGETVIRQRAPYAWQEHLGERRRVETAYRLTKAGDVAFTIGSYDRQLPLVIDPILLYSSYLNAYSSRVAVDAAGSVVVVTARFPGSLPRGIKIERLTPDGQTAIYTTLIGSDSDYLIVTGVTATPDGQVILAGWTSSPNVPLVNASQSYPGDGPFDNAFVLKLDQGGAFVFSTYLGGMRSDHASGVSVTPGGTIAVAGGTDSQDFPGIDGVHSASPRGFVTLFSASGSRLHGALLPVAITTLAVDPLGMVYVAGNTYSPDWPTTPESFQPTPHVAQCGDYGGPCLQGVLARINPDLGSLVYSTYLHTTGQQTQEVAVTVKALAVDAAGAAYILGYSGGGGFSATPGALQEQCPDYSCNFLTKLNPAGSARVYSTFLPGYASALQVDARGNAYLAGPAYLAVGGAATTPNALQPRAADAQLFVTSDGGATWRPTPPRYEANMGVALVHTTGPLLYTGYSSGNAQGLFKSADLGAHWQQIDSQVWGTLTIAPSNPNVMYEPLGRLVRRSSDGGATWALVPTEQDVRAFAVDPTDAQTLYMSGSGYPSAPGVFKSVNGGYAWSPANNGIDPGVTIDVIAVAPSNHNVLFAMGSRYVPTEVYGLYRSADGGASWTLVSPPASRFVGPLAVDPLDPARLYAFDSNARGLMRSTDGGAHWTLFADCWCFALAVTHAPDLTVFVASDDALARAVDAGGTAAAPLPVTLANGGVRQVIVDPTDPNVMVAVTHSGGDGFVSVIDPAGARGRYASYFGGSDCDGIGTMSLGPGGTLAISGGTCSRDLPLVNPRIPQRGAARFDSFVALMRIPLPALAIDAPVAGTIGQVFNVSGWAIDTGAPAGGGIDAVHVWAFPQDGGAPVFVGVASYGSARPDVGSAYGAQFTNSGFTVTGARLPEGPYTLAAFARSTVSGTFDAATRSVEVLSGGRMSVDAPGPDASLYQPFTIAGWAFDAAAPSSGTGVDAVHVWAYPDGGAPRFLGVATYGAGRPDVGAAFGSRFTASGFTLQASGLPAGGYTLVVFAHSLVSGAFDLVRTVRVTLPDGGAAAIDTPGAGGAVSTPFVVSGWALDRQGEGTGVDAIHIYAYPSAGGPPVFLGVASGVSRPDVATAFGDPRFAPSGYRLTVNTLPPGAYTVVVYARSGATGAFSITRSVQVIVN